MSRKWKILIIDDLPEMLESLKKLLDSPDKRILTTDKPENVPALLQEQDIDLIICDLMMPGMSGMQILRKARHFCPSTPVIMITAFGTVDRAVEAMKKGAFTFLEKPFSDERLLIVVEKALEHRRLFLEKNELLSRLSKEVLSEIVGQSEAIQHIKENIRRVGPTDTSILITGETGTGKEEVARAIHSLSERKDRSFVAINCSAVPEQLFESELFGHEKGAFTGAYQSKIGLMEEADGGTLFLDEIVEMTPALQVKLLRVLEDKKFRHVGGVKDISVDVRIIAATNRDTDQALAEKTLREDLYYRLSVFHFNLPPLRDRKGDIPILAKYFLTKASSSRSSGFSPSALKCLESYDWPGNVRELRNCIERAVLLAQDRAIESEDFPERINQCAERDLTIHSDLDFQKAKSELLQKFEYDYLIKLLKVHSGKLTEAAVTSGLSRRTLYRMLEKYKIDTRLWREK